MSFNAVAFSVLVLMCVRTCVCVGNINSVVKCTCMFDKVQTENPKILINLLPTQTWPLCANSYHFLTFRLKQELYIAYVMPSLLDKFISLNKLNLMFQFK